MGRVEASSCWPLEDGWGQSPADRGCRRGSDCADAGVCPSPSAPAPRLTAHERLGVPSADVDVGHVGARPCPPAGGAETTGTGPCPLGVCNQFVHDGHSDTGCRGHAVGNPESGKRSRRRRRRWEAWRWEACWQGVSTGKGPLAWDKDEQPLASLQQSERRLSRQTEGGIGRRDPRTQGCEGGRMGLASGPRPLGRGLEGMRSVTLCGDPEPPTGRQQRPDTSESCRGRIEAKPQPETDSEATGNRAGQSCQGPGRRQWQRRGTEKNELSGLQTTTFGMIIGGWGLGQ